MFPSSKESAQLREARESIEALERRFTPTLTLGQREMIAVRLRELAREVIAVGEPDALVDRYRAMEVKLDAADEAQFAELRERLYAGRFGPDDLRATLGAMPQYDWDPWTRRLFGLHKVPPTTVTLTADMVGYITTHVLQILEVASELGPDDVLYDLGTGLGMVPILSAWLTGAKAIGVEIEPAFVARAREQVTTLGLEGRVSIVEGDIRAQDYTDATAVFMFYPVRDRLLAEVIDRVGEAARARPIRIYSLGLSGPPLIAQDWIRVRGQSPSGLLALETQFSAKKPPGTRKKSPKKKSP